MRSHQALALSLIPALAACGGSGAASLGGGNLPGPAAFNELLLEGEAVLEKADGLEASESLPAENGVMYDGIMAIAATFLPDVDEEPPTEGYFGDFTATVDFNDGNMTGTGSGFFFASVDDEGDPDGPGQAVEGVITVTSANVGLGVVDFDISGTLFVDGALDTIDVGEGLGAFTGVDGDVLNVLGGMSFDGTETTLQTLIVAD